MPNPTAEERARDFFGDQPEALALIIALTKQIRQAEQAARNEGLLQGLDDALTRANEHLIYVTSQGLSARVASIKAVVNSIKAERQLAVASTLKAKP